MSSKRRAGLLSVLVALMVLGTLGTSVGGAGMARQAASPPQWRLITITHVKPDMIGAYDDLVKNDANPALKKAGVAWRWTLANFVSGPGFVRVSVQPLPNLAQFDQPGPMVRALGADGAALYNAKLRTMIVGTETFIDNLQPAISIQSNSSAPPAFLQVQEVRVLPGKGPEFISIMASDYLPHYRKLVKDYWAHARTFGGQQGTYILVRPFTKFAELDAGPLLTQAVGAEAAAKINARRGALTAASSIAFYRYVPELSYGMPGPAK